MMMMMELQQQDHSEADQAHTLTRLFLLSYGLLTISTERPGHYKELTVRFTQHEVIIPK